jgi:hypothetical protein
MRKSVATVGSGAKVKMSDRPADAADGIMSSQKRSRRRMNSCEPNGKTEATASTTRWLWNNGRPVRSAIKRPMVNLPAAGGP